MPVCMAAQKWKVSVTSLDTALKHWLRCYEIYAEDRKHLKRVYEMTYEDYCENPDRFHQEIAAFIGTRVPANLSGEEKFRYVTQWRDPVGNRVPENEMESVSGVHNTKYLDRWADMLKNSPVNIYYRYLVRKYEPEFAKHGYSLTTGLKKEMFDGALVAPVGAVCSGLASANALAWRTATQTRWWLKRHARALIPQALRSGGAKPQVNQTLPGDAKTLSL
jgi:hypothetical protein